MIKLMTSEFIIVCISGCSTLSPEAKKIKTYYLKARIPSECIELGKVKGEGESLMDQDAADAIAEDAMIQKAYDKYRANTVYIGSFGGGFGGGIGSSGYAEGIAYKCPQ